MIKDFFLVGLGGGIGSMARYYCQRLLNSAQPQHFPWGTFAVNISGCLLIGIIWGASLRSDPVNQDWKLFLMTGLCGGFTTFSAFTIEGNHLLKANKPGLFLLYVAGSVLLGLLATFAGMKLAR